MEKKHIKYFFNSANEQEYLKSCLDQIFDFLNKSNLSIKNILIATIFVKVDSDYKTLKAEIEKQLFRYYFDVPYLIISQTPYNADIAIEILYIHDDFKIKESGEDFKLIEYDNSLELYASKSYLSNKIYDSADLVFHDLIRILKKYKFNISDIVRQWNYIENIIAKNGNTQNYQDFNDIRSYCYLMSAWNKGYPAATGIGTISGGVNIGIIAVKQKDSSEILPLKNPNQIDAHSYSEKVLLGQGTNKSTPKFERGKVVINKDTIDFYISGTAAILGEETINDINIESQTKTTIENIFSLISIYNLKKQIPTMYHRRFENLILTNMFSNVRVYVKSSEDIEIAKIICKQYFGDVPMIFLTADICRENLLIEIEGNIFI